MPPSTAQLATQDGQQAEHDLGDLLCDLLPRQGAWSDDDYLWLTDHSRRLVEFTDGCIEALPMPTTSHQAILAFLHFLFRDWIRPRGGMVVEAPLRVRMREGKFREPDLAALLDRDDPRRQDRYWLGADLVVEVVSPDQPSRDLVDKRLDYAEAGIAEYWIADPRSETVTVLSLQSDSYAEHGVFGRRDTATSALLEGFAADVGMVFDAPTTGA